MTYLPEEKTGKGVNPENAIGEREEMACMNLGPSENEVAKTPDSEAKPLATYLGEWLDLYQRHKGRIGLRGLQKLVPQGNVHERLRALDSGPSPLGGVHGTFSSLFLTSDKEIGLSDSTQEGPGCQNESAEAISRTHEQPK